MKRKLGQLRLAALLLHLRGRRISAFRNRIFIVVAAVPHQRQSASEGLGVCCLGVGDKVSNYFFEFGDLLWGKLVLRGGNFSHSRGCHHRGGSSKASTR